MPNVLFLLMLSAILLPLTVRVVSRKKMTAPYVFVLAVLAVVCDLLAFAYILLPQNRMELFSSGGLLTIRYGKSALLACTALPVVLGVLVGLFVEEECAERAPGGESRRGKTIHAALHVLLLVLLILSQAYFWARKAYPKVHIDEIVFYLQMPLQGTAQGFVHSLLHSVFFPALSCFAAIEALTFFPAKRTHDAVLLKRFRLRFFPLRLPKALLCAVLAVWFAVLLVLGERMLEIRTFVSGYFDTSTLIGEEYVSPDSVAITFPQEKRNLITIYLESAESTTQDMASGGALGRNLIPEMTRIANENVSFSQSEQIAGASVAPECGWTIAGLVAQTAGVPMKTPRHNFASKLDTFLPGAVTLGDILKREGYRNVFMAGSDFTFGGRRRYYQQHGDYEIWDHLTAIEEDRIPKDYYHAWGFEDQKLYAFAKEKLTELAAGDQPFHFAMLTVDPHAPGYRCDLCPTEYLGAERDFLQYADVLRCSSMQLDSFLAWLREQDFYENTTIVIAGDHASNQDYFFGNLDLLGAGGQQEDVSRLVYNAFVNSAVEPVQEKNRVFTTIDFFPTVLASMGVSIEGDRLGLGTNLFSAEPTLSEKYGEETLFAEMRKRSVFYEEELLYPKE